ncbi:MAG TPA: ABC transporter permease/substrate-binding protein [Candidatus Anammoximicrobium sp.]|nr:ABC transporter permease/substrate-binding protein [Candidatus Anammoximicrobium sp.]
MSAPWAELVQKLPLYLGGHLTLSVAAMAVGLLVSLPLGLAASGRPRLAEWVLGAAGIVQTVPSLALLALMVPLLGGLIGFWPALLALVLYSILPMLANTIAGLRGVDPALIEAARGVGMSPRQMLWRVELPLAAPVILGGVRTATVLVVGMVTLVTTVGGASLGNYIFSGLESFNDLLTSVGCVFAALLALILDQLVHLLELASQRRSRRLAWLGAGGLLVAVAASLYYPMLRIQDWRAAPPQTAAAAVRETGGGAELLTELSSHLSDLLQNLPVYLGGHMALSLSALAVGLLISVPLGILASRRPKLAEGFLGIAGVIQTVPTLAMLALMVLLLQGRVGFRPSFTALTLYSILPILANTILGIRGVEPALIEAARGLGMSSRQMLCRVQLPLAAPVILAGVRTATVLVVGTATLVTPVGGRSLGNYIFAGLESLNYTTVVFGCVMAGLLAVVLDQLVHLLELAAQQRRPRLAWIGGAGLLLAAMGSLFYPVYRFLDWRAHPVRIASGPFTEQHVLNEVLAQHLIAAGFRPDRRTGMSEGIQFKGLFHSDIDCIVNYSGNIWTLVMKEDEFVSPAESERRITQYLRQKHGVACLGGLGFENAYAMAMPNSERRPPEFQRVHTVADLAEMLRASKRPLRLGGDMQFFERPEWRRVKDVYRLEDQWFRTVPMDPTRMYDAVVDGQVDAIVAYSSDGRIPEYQLEILGDAAGVFPKYDALLLVSQRGAQNPRLTACLQQLVGAVSQQAMQEANRQVDVRKRPAPTAAAELLERVPGRSPVRRGTTSKT